MGPSFEDVFASEFRPLYRYLRRRVPAATAEEIAEATFATAFAKWESLDPTRPAKPWLYGIAANLLRHHWRSERRMLNAYARTGYDAIVNPEELAVEHASASTEIRLLAGELAKLRRTDREMLLLYAWAELSDGEIADALDLPVGTVKSRLSRMR